MADYLPRADSLWSTTTWITAFSNLTAFAGVPPMSADDVYADGKTITIDTNINVATLRTTTAPRTGGVAGGGFRANNNTVINANILAGTTTVVTFASASPNSTTIFGNVSGSSTVNSVYPVNNSSTGTLTISGNFATCNSTGRLFTNGGGGTMNINFPLLIGATAGTVAGAGIYNVGTMNLSGIVTLNNSNAGYSNAAGDGFITTDAGVLNLSGSFIGAGGGSVGGRLINLNGGTLNGIGVFRQDGNGSGNAASLVRQLDNTILNLSGTFIAALGGNSFVINIATGSLGSTNLNGNFLGGGGNNGAYCVYMLGSTRPITITGSITGGTTNSGATLYSIGTTRNLTINGNLFGGNTGPALFTETATTNVITINGSVIGTQGNAVINQGSNTIYIKRVVGGPGGPTNPSGGTAAGLSNAQNGLAYAEEIAFGDQGATPVSGPVFLVNRTNTVLVMEGPPPTFTSTTLFGNLNVPNLFPPVNSVRQGVVYGSGDFTGTMIVPPPQAVQVGVPVDNTVGTFVLSPESFWTIQRSNSAFNDPTTIGYRIKNLATIPSVGQLIGSFNLDDPYN